MLLNFKEMKISFHFKQGSGSQKDETYDSACFDHEKTFNHKIDYENFKILDRATIDQMVLIKENLH
jgi:hypothetical protein